MIITEALCSVSMYEKIQRILRSCTKLIERSWNFEKKWSPPGGLEPPTFRLTVERASQLRHGGVVMEMPGKRGLETTGDFLECCF